MSEEQGQPEGWEQIDYDKLQPDVRPVVEARIGRLYGQVKEGQRVMNQLADDNKTLLGRLKGIEDNIQTGRTGDIKAELKQAAEAGDYERIATLTEELVKTTSKAAEETAPQKKETPGESGTQNPVDVTEHMSADEEAFVAAWYAEKDGNGNPIRPWANQGHQDFQAAANVFTMNWNRPSVKDQGVKAVLAEVDRVMGTQKPAQKNASVMRSSSSGPSSGTNQSKSKLTTEQRQAAELLGVSEEDYSKEVATMQANEKAGDKPYRKVIAD